MTDSEDGDVAEPRPEIVGEPCPVVKVVQVVSVEVGKGQRVISDGEALPDCTSKVDETSDVKKLSVDGQMVMTDGATDGSIVITEAGATGEMVMN